MYVPSSWSREYPWFWHDTLLFTAVIDKTAGFVANSANPVQFEDKIRENQRHDPKFAFLNPADPYHAYYRHRIEKIMQGDAVEEGTPVKSRAQSMQVDEEVSKPKSHGKEPPPPEFILDLPNITAVDLWVFPLLIDWI